MFTLEILVGIPGRVSQYLVYPRSFILLKKILRRDAQENKCLKKLI